MGCGGRDRHGRRQRRRASGEVRHARRRGARWWRPRLEEAAETEARAQPPHRYLVPRHDASSQAPVVLFLSENHSFCSCRERNGRRLGLICWIWAVTYHTVCVEYTVLDKARICRGLLRRLSFSLNINLKIHLVHIGIL
jgi:hypothetical protein